MKDTFYARMCRPTPEVDCIIAVSDHKEFGAKIIPDSGATQTMIATSVLTDRQITYSVRQIGPIRAANQQILECEGEMNLTLEIDGKRAEITAVVCRELSDNCLLYTSPSPRDS